MSDKNNELAVEAQARGVSFRVGARGGLAIGALFGAWMLWLLL